MSKADVFIVMRQGIYDQGVVGVFTDYADAKKAAEVAASEEPDDWHGFNIMRMALNQRQLEPRRSRDVTVALA